MKKFKQFDHASFYSTQRQRIKQVDQQIMAGRNAIVYEQDSTAYVIQFFINPDIMSICQESCD
jgi:hypothetical protein